MPTLARVIFTCLALLCPTQTLADWREVTTDHFIVYSEEPAAAVAAYAEKLERFDLALRRLHGMKEEVPPASAKLTVYVLPGPEAVSDMYGRKGGSIGGFYVPHARGAIAFTPRPSRQGGRGDFTGQLILLHEYAHHFMLSNFSAAFPSWYVEGFAEFAGTAEFNEDGSVVIGRPPQFRAQSIHGRTTSLTVSEMVQPNRRYTDTERAELYGRGWLLTHYLNFHAARKGQLGTYIRSLNAGKDPVAAAKETFGDLDVLDKELNRYAAGKLLAVKFDPAPGRKFDVRVRELTPGENATMQVRMRSRRGVDLEEAKRLLPAARRAAAPYPNDAVAQRVLAEAEFDAGNLAEAEAAADRALAADPNFAEATVYKGMVRLQQALDAKDGDAPAWREARRLFAGQPPGPEQSGAADLLLPELSRRADPQRRRRTGRGVPCGSARSRPALDHGPATPDRRQDEGGARSVRPHRLLAARRRRA
jgi:tetratricopeptide (TPR) repeat protein